MLIKLHPALTKTQLENAVQNSDGTLRGVVLEAYGTGNCPTWVNLVIESLYTHGIPVVAVTQCARGHTFPSYKTALVSATRGLFWFVFNTSLERQSNYGL